MKVPPSPPQKLTKWHDFKDIYEQNIKKSLKHLSKHIPTLLIEDRYNNKTQFVQNDVILFLNPKCHLLPEPSVGGALINTSHINKLY